METIPVSLTILDNSNADGDNTKIELNTVGTFSGTPDDYKIVYTEQDEELLGCETTLHVEKRRKVTMSRSGAYTSEMIMEKAQRHTCHYATLYGDLMMGVFAHHVDSDVENGEGKLEFFYTLDCNGGLLAKNELTITVKPASER